MLETMREDFLLLPEVGFAAEIVHGAMGMALGVTATTVMLSLGTPPATASTCAHAAEVFTTGSSGIAHWRMGNPHAEPIWQLADPGMIGGGAALRSGTGIGRRLPRCHSRRWPGTDCSVTLSGSGTNPRFAIASLNVAEFFATATISATLVLTIGLELWPRPASI